MSAPIRVNGEARALPGPRLIDLLHALDIDPAGRGIAVAVNGMVVPRAGWDDPNLTGGEDIEIVRPLQGG